MKAPGFNPWAFQVKPRFQSLLSQNLTCTTTPGGAYGVMMQVTAQHGGAVYKLNPVYP
jgi:hypothetical protein